MNWKFQLLFCVFNTQDIIKVTRIKKIYANNDFAKYRLLKKKLYMTKYN